MWFLYLFFLILTVVSLLNRRDILKEMRTGHICISSIMYHTGILNTEKIHSKFGMPSEEGLYTMTNELRKKLRWRTDIACDILSLIFLGYALGSHDKMAGYLGLIAVAYQCLMWTYALYVICKNINGEMKRLNTNQNIPENL